MPGVDGRVAQGLAGAGQVGQDVQETGAALPEDPADATGGPWWDVEATRRIHHQKPAKMRGISPSDGEASNMCDSSDFTGMLMVC